MAELLIAWSGNQTSGRPIRAQWEDLGSTLVCGKPSFGKTTTIAYLCAQAVLQGIRLAVADPHGGEEQSMAAKLAPLSQMYWRPVALSEDACLRMVQSFASELHRRKERAGEYFAKTGQPWNCATDGDVRLVLIVDEINRLLRRFKKSMADLLKDIGQEGRKFGMFAILSGQHFTAAALGSTELRSAFVSSICHRMDPEMASMITDLPKDTFRTAPGLNRGECFIKLAGRDDVLIGQVPAMTQADIEEVARSLSDSPPLLRMPAETVVARSEVKVSEETRATLWAEKGRLLALVLEGGNSYGDAAMIVMGRPTSTTGRPRFEGTRVVEEIVRTYIGELQQRVEAVAV